MTSDNKTPVSKWFSIYFLSLGGVLVTYWLGSWTGDKIGYSIGLAGAILIGVALIFFMFYRGLMSGRRGK